MIRIFSTSMKKRHFIIGAACAAAVPSSANASEGGASFYLLGSGGPGAGVPPPLEGIYFDETVYIYSGEAQGSQSFVVGGEIVTELEADIIASFTNLIWVPSTKVLGGTLSLQTTLPIGSASVDVNTVITGPSGGQIPISESDSAVVVGDPVLAASLGWSFSGNTHLSLSTSVNIPVGHYREGELANFALHRWVVDQSAAFTWKDPESGWDLSGKAGVTFNGRNADTDYKTGTELHIEAAVEKRLSSSVSAGLQAFHINQVTGDTGEGAVLGSLKGRGTAIGATAAYNFKLFEMPATARIRYLEEFNVKNRLSGRSVFLSLTVPLSLTLPSKPAN